MAENSNVVTPETTTTNWKFKATGIANSVILTLDDTVVADMQHADYEALSVKNTQGRIVFSVQVTDSVESQLCGGRLLLNPNMKPVDLNGVKQPGFLVYCNSVKEMQTCALYLDTVLSAVSGAKAKAEAAMVAHTE